MSAPDTRGRLLEVAERLFSERGFAERRTRRRMRIRVSVATTALAFCVIFLNGVVVHAQPTTTLKAETIEAFDRYVGSWKRELLKK